MKDQAHSENRFVSLVTRLRKFRLPLVIAFYVLTIPLSYICTFYIRFDFKIPDRYWLVILHTLIPLFFAKLLAYSAMRIYLSSWQFTSLQDLMDVVKSVFLGSAIALALFAFLEKMDDFPRSIVPIDAVMSIFMIASARLFLKYCYEGFGHSGSPHQHKRVLIVGAGFGGNHAIHEMKINPTVDALPIGLVDDNIYLMGTKREGIPVLGNTHDIPMLVAKYAIDEVVVAIPSGAHKDIVRITDICKNKNISVRVLPSHGKFIQDATYTGRLKEVLTDDLLGRRLIRFSQVSDLVRMKDEIEGKVVFISGAGGSIGSELCRQVALYYPKLLIMYERYETSLNDLELEMQRTFPKQAILPILGDILDTKKVDQILATYLVSIIYHAAAYKHVPVMEREPMEAVRNNISGTYRLGQLAIKNNVKKFVMISTDKAVKPSSIMGATKRVAELIVQHLNANSECQFVAVRFGNVIGSNGSVIPLFKKQIAEGGPVTVTHKDMTRYFMAITEAVQLVLMAGAIGKGGEIFLLDMGQPIKILEVAEALIRRTGLVPNEDVDIVFSGIRPGEKLHEELFWSGDGIVSTEHKSITMLKPHEIDDPTFLESVHLLELDIIDANVENVIPRLQKLVQDFTIDVKYEMRGAAKII
jgi:FlaA1/EpsC-like NDP-sugar epimerase